MGILKKSLKGILYTFLVLVLLVVSVLLFTNIHPTFGDSPNDESLTKIKNSIHFQNGKFQNLVTTSIMTPSEDDYSITEFLFSPEGKNPEVPLPSVKLNIDNIKNETFTWLGHASVLMKTSNLTILTDPVFHRASPIFIGGEPFSLENPLMLEDLPKIDAIAISHDHYDHLEYQGIKQLANKVDKFFVPLGVKAHVMKWGVNQENITELDWYESAIYKGVEFTLVPARHYSGRGITNGYSTLWGGWVFKSDSQNVFFSGDSGYFDEFKEIGNRYGPFDISFIDAGAYNQSWAHVHMMPEESVQASIDVNSKTYLPIGWARFDLAPHFWDAPIIRATKEAERLGVNITTPLIGQTFSIDNAPKTKWWEPLR